MLTTGSVVDWPQFVGLLSGDYFALNVSSSLRTNSPETPSPKCRLWVGGRGGGGGGGGGGGVLLGRFLLIVQTRATVGYGLCPTTGYGNILTTVESLVRFFVLGLAVDDWPDLCPVLAPDCPD